MFQENKIENRQSYYHINSPIFTLPGIRAEAPVGRTFKSFLPGRVLSIHFKKNNIKENEIRSTE